MNSFDLVASRFERHRALPSHVPAAIRRVLHEHGGIDAKAPLLEVGCGTGRIGAEFSAAGDNYLGLDLSMGMLREFQRKETAGQPNLVYADGCQLPFHDRVFRAVLMVQLLSAHNWRSLLAEAHRILQSGGVLAIGKTEGPSNGIDAKMRNRLDGLISDMGIAVPLPHHGQMGEWLRAASSRHIEIKPAQWIVERTPREFFVRKQSAARFLSLPADIREPALQSLTDWTEQNIGPLDTPHKESYHFRLDLYWLHGRCGA